VGGEKVETRVPASLLGKRTTSTTTRKTQESQLNNQYQRRLHTRLGSRRKAKEKKKEKGEGISLPLDPSKDKRGQGCRKKVRAQLHLSVMQYRRDRKTGESKEKRA